MAGTRRLCFRGAALPSAFFNDPDLFAQKEPSPFAIPPHHTQSPTTEWRSSASQMDDNGVCERREHKGPCLCSSRLSSPSCVLPSSHLPHHLTSHDRHSQQPCPTTARAHLRTLVCVSPRLRPQHSPSCTQSWHTAPAVHMQVHTVPVAAAALSAVAATRGCSDRTDWPTMTCGSAGGHQGAGAGDWAATTCRRLEDTADGS